MLSFLPSLFTYEGFAPLLLRLTLAAVFIFWSYGKLKKRSGQNSNTAVGLLDAVVGILLVIGLWTQIAALIAAIMLAVGIVKKAKKGLFFSDGVNYYFILFIIAVSLLLTGSGLWALDLPL